MDAAYLLVALEHPALPASFGVPYPHCAVMRARHHCATVRADGYAKHWPKVPFTYARQLLLLGVPDLHQAVLGPGGNDAVGRAKGKRLHGPKVLLPALVDGAVHALAEDNAPHACSLVGTTGVQAAVVRREAGTVDSAAVAVQLHVHGTVAGIRHTDSCIAGGGDDGGAVVAELHALHPVPMDCQVRGLLHADQRPHRHGAVPAARGH
mmetsp:Transcript_6727/g.18828  ORF Transcript_6727/g.18828 Transcript_6727/m.18828 type:complete len:208 (-) Transcript_6727:3570-4193(-)